MTRKKADLYSQEAEREAKAPGKISTELEQQEGQATGDVTTAIPDDSPVIPESNDNPYRQRITNRKNGLPRLWQLLKNKIKPPPTVEELAAMSEKKRTKLLEKTLTEEAIVSAKRLSHALHVLGFSYVRKSNDGNIVKARYVQFDFAETTEDAIWLHVDMDKWPPGCNTDDLIEQKVINHLSRSVGHKLNVRSSPEAGVWFIVERASGMMGIPVHVPINDMWARIPSTAGNMTVPIGMTQNRKVVFDDIDSMVHVMVAGQTGGGKSTLINGWITTLITRNRPDQLQLLLMDMKAGLEFQFFEDLPHLVKMPGVATDHGIITDPDQVAPALKWLINVEAKQRLLTIRAAEHRDIKSYNARRKVKMPRIVAIIDEWAQARMGNNGKEAEHELAKALQLLRAAGIHLIVCTQTPSKEVLGVLARSNLPTRIAFSCSEMAASILITGDNSAMNLQPAGRCIFRRFSSSQPVQVAWIAERHVKGIVTDVKAGKISAVTVAAHDVTIEEVLAWSLHENQGSLKWQDVFNHFNHRGITQDEVLTGLKQIEGKSVEIEGNLYRVEPGAGRKARRLVVMTDLNPAVESIESLPEGI